MAPLPRGAVSEREGPWDANAGKRIMLSYVNQHYVRQRLVDVFGPLGFDTETRLRLVSGPTRVQETRKRRNGETYEVDNWLTVYEATVRVTVRAEDGTVSVKEGSAGGVGEDKQPGWSVHLACTEAETDALKRAAMQLGPSFGLALYDKTQGDVVGDSCSEILRLVDDGKIDEARAESKRLWSSMSGPDRKRVTAAIEAAASKSEAA